MKYWGWSADYILYDISWSNVSMYLATIPSFDVQEKEDGEQPQQETKELDSLDDFVAFLNMKG